METNLCPDCQKALTWISTENQAQDHFHCSSCENEWVMRMMCPDCQSELERIQACGSTSYFCPSCNELKSKSRVIQDWQKKKQ